MAKKKGPKTIKGQIRKQINSNGRRTKAKKGW
jgi:hypothetical protein